MEGEPHESRRRLVQVWWSVLLAVVVTLGVGTVSYFLAMRVIAPPGAHDAARSW